MVSCRVEGCSNPANVPGSARDLCRAHYRRWQRYGTELEPLRRIMTYAGDECSEIGCVKPVMAHGLCDNHDHKMRRRCDPEGQRRRNLAFKERFRSKQEQLMGRPRPLLCELCNQPGEGRGSKKWAGICFDHDHKTGQPRGWLCDRCNKILGLVDEDQELLIKMIAYLKMGGPKFRRQIAKSRLPLVIHTIE